MPKRKTAETVSEFIRARPKMAPSDIVAAGAKAGLRIKVQRVYNIRSYDQSRRKSKTKAKTKHIDVLADRVAAVAKRTKRTKRAAKPAAKPTAKPAESMSAPSALINRIAGELGRIAAELGRREAIRLINEWYEAQLKTLGAP